MKYEDGIDMWTKPGPTNDLYYTCIPSPSVWISRLYLKTKTHESITRNKKMYKIRLVENKSLSRRVK